MKYSLNYNSGSLDLKTNPEYKNKSTATDKLVEKHNSPKQLQFNFDNKPTNSLTGYLTKNGKTSVSGGPTLKNTSPGRVGLAKGTTSDTTVMPKNSKMDTYLNDHLIVYENKKASPGETKEAVARLEKYGIEESSKKVPGYPTQAKQFREPSTWELMKKTADNPEDRNQIKRILNKEYYKYGEKYLDKSDLKFIGKSKDPIKPTVETPIEAPIFDESILSYHNQTTEPQIPLDQKIKILADKRLQREQKAWDQTWGIGGITDLKRPT